MARLLLDDGFAHHPKVVALRPRERWVWLELLCYCARYRTGGTIPRAAAEVVRGATPGFIARAFELGLLDEAEGEGWQVHDWGMYNGATIADRVAAFVRNHPEASANEVAREVSGRRDIVLQEVAKLKRNEGREPWNGAGSAGSEDTGAGTEGGSESGSPIGSYRRARAITFGPVPVTKGQAVALDGGRSPERAPATGTDDQLEPATSCPLCGPLHSVPRDFTMSGHLTNVHGLEGAELAEALERAG